MRRLSGRMIGLAVVTLALASGTADAQLRRKGTDDARRAGQGTVYDHRSSNGVIFRDRDRDRDRDWDRNRSYGNGRKVPPGLSRKPGQMPPGQYKKRYGSSQGADVLSGVLRRRGYPVLRVVPSGDSRYVYYRLRDGSERRAIVSPGGDRLRFEPSVRTAPGSARGAVLEPCWSVPTDEARARIVIRRALLRISTRVPCPARAASVDCRTHCAAPGRTAPNALSARTPR